MDNLPIELLDKIFYPLHQNDKVECLMVCRAWKNALEKTCLFSIVRLQSTEQFNKLVNRITHDTRQRPAVGCLLIEMNHITRTDIDLLPFLFSSVREVTFYERMIKNRLPYTKVLSPHIWSRTIRCIKEKKSQLFTYNILKGGVCPVLTEIAIGGSHYLFKSELIQLLGNAPSLHVLTIRNCIWNLLELELLHKKAPLLSSLSLEYGYVNPFPLDEHINTEPINTEPANSIMKLSLQIGFSLSTESGVVLLNYLRRKYPKVVNLEYSFYFVSGLALDECMTRGFIPYIRQISPHLVSLKLPSFTHFQKLSPVLEENNCLLREYVCTGPISKTGITQITQSRLAQAIQKLSLGVDYGWDEVFMDRLSNLTALTELNISDIHTRSASRRYQINISDLLKAVGNNLTVLKISRAAILFNHTSSPTYHNLKKLMLISSNTPNNIDFFICKAFPNLNTLVIDHCYWKTSSFNLGDLKLSHLEFRHCFPSNSHILTVTLCNNEKRWYTANKVSTWNKQPDSWISECPAIHSFPFDKYDGFPFVTFVCGSLYLFLMVNTGA